MGRMRPAAWIAIATVTAACGLDFDRFDPSGGSEGSTEPPDGTVEESASGPSGGGVEAAAEAAAERGIDGPADSSVMPDQSADLDAPGACATSAACGGSTAFCNAAHMCVQCLVTADCTAPTPYCSPTSATCVQCLSNGNCTSPATPVCSNQQCVGCETNADCPGSRPYCNAPDGGARGSCVVCLQNSQCPMRRPTCTNGTCG